MSGVYTLMLPQSADCPSDRPVGSLGTLVARVSAGLSVRGSWFPPPQVDTKDEQ